METSELLDALKVRLSAVSDYDLSKKMGWSRQRVSNYRNRNTMDDKAAISAAAALGIDPGQVLAWMQSERADDPDVAGTWKEIADRLGDQGDKQNYPKSWTGRHPEMEKKQELAQIPRHILASAHIHAGRLSDLHMRWLHAASRSARTNPAVDVPCLFALRFQPAPAI